MSAEPARWSQPFAALLGAYEAQMELGLPSIGGKDSMSGTFEDIDVPPTLVSFAVCVGDDRCVISPELKKAGSRLAVLACAHDEQDRPLLAEQKKLYQKLHEEIAAGRVISAYAMGRFGLAEALPHRPGAPWSLRSRKERPRTCRSVRSAA